MSLNAHIEANFLIFPRMTRNQTTMTIATKILDCFGNPVDHGKTWYWARNIVGQTAGVGKFMRTMGAGIGSDEWTFWINGTGYPPEMFSAFCPTEPPTWPERDSHP